MEQIQICNQVSYRSNEWHSRRCRISVMLRGADQLVKIFRWGSKKLSNESFSLAHLPAPRITPAVEAGYHHNPIFLHSKNIP